MVIKKHIYRLLLKARICMDFTKEYRMIKSITDEKSLLRFQKEQLKYLILHADKNVPYYHRVFKEIGILNNGVDLSKFDKIPILTKEIMSKHYKNLISKDCKNRRWYYNSSGGSTGEPTRFIQDDCYSKWSNATQQHYYQDLLGIDERNVKKIILWGSERDVFKGSVGLKSKVGHWLTNTILLNSFRMTRVDMEKYIKIINSFKPELIRGYAGSLYELCRYAKKKKLTISAPKILISAAETLKYDMREKIEGVFGIKLYDFYGSRETASIAAECKNGLMHVFMFNNYVEILDNHNQPVQEGKEGRVIVTNLHNYSMPFIRYEIGDVAVVGPEQCECGNPLPTLKKVTGRITDHFVKEDGTIIHGEFFTHLFYLKDWVKAFQIIQEDYNKIRILAVTTGRVNEHQKKDIEKKIKVVMEKDCKIQWEIVEDIPPTKSGKYLYTKSLVWR